MKLLCFCTGVIVGLMLWGVAWAEHERDRTKYDVCMGHSCYYHYDVYEDAVDRYNELTRRTSPGQVFTLVEEDCRRRVLSQTGQ
jgi:hypothetical protein